MPTVHIVDDNFTARRVEAHASPEAFLRRVEPGQAVCVIADLHMPAIPDLISSMQSSGWAFLFPPF
jgi:FixJ family two-component response regulator